MPPGQNYAQKRAGMIEKRRKNSWQRTNHPRGTGSSPLPCRMTTPPRWAIIAKLPDVATRLPHRPCFLTARGHRPIFLHACRQERVGAKSQDSHIRRRFETPKAMPPSGEQRKTAASPAWAKRELGLSHGVPNGKVERKIHIAAYKKGSGARSRRWRRGQTRLPEGSLLELHHTRHYQCGKQTQSEAYRLPQPNARALYPTRSTRLAARLHRWSHSSATCCSGHPEHHHRGAAAPPCLEDIQPTAARSHIASRKGAPPVATRKDTQHNQALLGPDLTYKAKPSIYRTKVIADP
jgi:hypothetical protein